MLISQLTENTSVLSTGQLTQLQQLSATLNPIQQAWVSGYLAASSQMGGQLSALSLEPIKAEPIASQTLTILYGSQTGNAKGIAQQLKTNCEHKGFTVELVNAGDYKAAKLKKETHLLILVSTHGEGEPPEDIETLHKFVFGKKAPDLSQLNFAVLALGDSSYEYYCQTGKDFDEQLEKLGAKRLFDRIDCDVDYEADAQSWSTSVVDLLEPELKKPTQVGEAQVIPLNPNGVMAHEYSKNNPFTAKLLASQKITGRDSGKDVRHIEIDLEGSNIQYQPGDSLGVWFDNDEALADQLLSALSIDPAQSVSFDDTVTAIKALLVKRLELTQLHPGFVTAYADLTNNEALQTIAADKATLREFIADRQVIDVVSEYPGTVEAADLVKSLRKITPRLYSIASSQAEVEEEVHLTVGVVAYEAFGQPHLGGASGFLAHRLEEDADVNVYVEDNNNFRLPASEETPVIMIGPGTGIAPFRAFLQQRDQQGSTGDNWLFFGNPHFTQDFLYQTELQDLQKRGVLNNLDVAFSRDQAKKVYVQDRLLENGEAIYQWLSNGAHVYICGDGARMAKDVHNALLAIVGQYGNLDSEQAEEYLSELRSNKRYQKDVY
ncbi:MAG: assimilatory sulfite reductase (NADPH) flavoprotein subunit [Algicola sp.]|nr:assimilatory sulfite reductase (NADPH) flavoprotein subunit [Algicola sp.]